jgi:hypothetical protein
MNIQLQKGAKKTAEKTDFRGTESAFYQQQQIKFESGFCALLHNLAVLGALAERGQQLWTSPVQETEQLRRAGRAERSSA